ncbi:hypothetical protein RND71_026353 [Anisodus tanguticus]|uniref:Uncharacterized protein n=1 Tax=Anisodus tanguticus TaxID=243964 RepID=A0AAE1VAF0_9SOLA|nr:hypothetical protein RND71_026353 [Anisodus tanguticus]
MPPTYITNDHQVRLYLMNVDKDGSRPRLYISLEVMIVESLNSSAVANSSVTTNSSGAANTSGSTSPFIDEDPCNPPMDNNIYEDHCEPLMNNDCPDNVHGDDLENSASNNHSYIDK